MNLEKQIYEQVTQGIAETIKSRLTQGYSDSPLNKLVDQVVTSKLGELRSLMEESLDGALKGDFRQQIKDALTHKMARLMVSKMKGELEKRIVELRASPEFRARITLAVEAAIKEHQRKP